MQPGPLTVESEAGDKWQSNLYLYSASRSIFCIKKAWSLVVAALQLEAGQTICLAALGPSRLLISRQGEPHFSAAASQGPPDPWPLTVRLSQSSVHASMCRLSAAAGRNICREGVQSVPAVILHHSPSSTAGEAVDDLSTLVVSFTSVFICVPEARSAILKGRAFWQTRQLCQLHGDIHRPETAAAHACSETNVVPAYSSVLLAK